ncbi:MAG: Hsp20/alpha crystallin family protein [Bryobacterales bacterium]|nr:Hsp20/alpha crystallin family protein [Bryobacterales bacterium]
MLNTLLANDVRQTLEHFRRSVDQMFENFYGYQTQPGPATPAAERTWTFSPVLESAWTDNFLNLRAVLPGVTEKDVRVSVQNNQLVIEGERKAPEGFEKNAFTQLMYGKFYTAVTLPAGLDVDHVQCKLHNGILDIRMPILESSKPRQIQIQTEERKVLTS